MPIGRPFRVRVGGLGGSCLGFCVWCFVLGLLGFCFVWGGLIRGFCHSRVPSDVDLPGGFSVGPVVEATTACASDRCDAVCLFVSLCWVGGCPLNGPKVPLPFFCFGFCLILASVWESLPAPMTCVALVRTRHSRED